MARKTAKFSPTLYAKYVNFNTPDEYLNTDPVMAALIEPNEKSVLVAEYRLVTIHRASSVVVVKTTDTKKRGAL